MLINKAISLILSSLCVVAVGLAEPPHRSGAASVENFLVAAEIVRQDRAAGHEYGTYRAVLSDGQETRTAVVQTVTPHSYMGYELREHFAYNAVAYRLDRILGAGVVSPTALRKIDGAWASVTLADSPDSLVHPSASDRVAVFRALVADSSGSFATGFGETKALFGLRGPVAIDEQFQTALAGLNRDRLKEEFGEWLSDRQIRFLLARRNRILSRCGTMDASGAVGAE